MPSPTGAVNEAIRLFPLLEGATETREGEAPASRICGHA